MPFGPWCRHISPCKLHLRGLLGWETGLSCPPRTASVGMPEFPRWGAAQFQEFGSPVNEGQHFNRGALDSSPEESHGVDFQLVLRRINLMVTFFLIKHRILDHLLIMLVMLLAGYQLGSQALVFRPSRLLVSALAGIPVMSA